MILPSWISYARLSEESVEVKNWLSSIQADLEAIKLTTKASMVENSYIDTAMDCCDKTMARIEEAKNII